MDIYFADLPGVRVLGPYTKDEIQPQLRARRLLGWPERGVLYIEAAHIGQAKEKARRAASRHSFYVKRRLWEPCRFGDRVSQCYHNPRCGQVKPGDGTFGRWREGWTGPIRGAAQAVREVSAWRTAGWEAEYVLSSATVRAQVRAWEKASKS